MRASSFTGNNRRMGNGFSTNHLNLLDTAHRIETVGRLRFTARGP